MPISIQTRASQPGDHAAIEALYTSAFPDEDLLPLVRALLRAPTNTLSLVASAEDTLAGHVAFTRCGVSGCPDHVALLGPLAVTPAMQRRGVGSALVRAGLADMRAAGLNHACVLGDPAYYGRFGFAPERDILPPYPLPADWSGAWQSTRLTDDAPTPRGGLVPPAPWRDPALWSA